MALACLMCSCQPKGGDVWLEAERFSSKGGWVTDQQFMNRMGSPYLMAHGMGKPVEDASTTLTFPGVGTYYIYVRTYNWTSPWTQEEGAGKFQVLIDNKPVDATFGHTGHAWEWQRGGAVEVRKRKATVTLRDLTGFNGRCDALYFTTDPHKRPPAGGEELSAFRYQQTGIQPEKAGEFDLVVVGGGVAGICAAVSAARLHMKVALIHDRPVWGGNNSSEVRVHLGGRINLGPYPALGGVVKELSPEKGGNAQPADRYEDRKKADLIHSEPNITPFMNYYAFAVEKNGSSIQSVTAKQVETGEELIFSAPLFADCTGDGSIGALAGADFVMGRESTAGFGETTAPGIADKLTMGSSVQWYSKEQAQPSSFPVFRYGIDFHEANAEKVTMGEWTWETGMNINQITDFERIRDYGMMVIFSNWSFLKNESAEKDSYANRALEWVAYVSGKRESRRLLGDYILKEQDITSHTLQEDGTASTSWSIDLHYPDPKNTEHFPGTEFKSIAKHIQIHPYPIPYRCFYSRNVDNLFMAGRNISVTHVALGTVRVMRTTGMMGEVVGMAASLCKAHQANPRDVYNSYLPDLVSLMQQGIGKESPAGYPDYNLGGTLGEK